MLRSFYRRFKLESGLGLGLATFCAGALILAWQLAAWYAAGTPASDPAWITLAATLVNLGCQTAFFSLFISSMSMKKTAGQPGR